MDVVEERSQANRRERNRKKGTSESVSLCSKGMSGGMPDPGGQCQQEGEEEKIEKHR
ncbi:hypothetical protein K0M31_000820 [Melipona bicolor]|uniref:Uncharacterized protein n=1 Tax=Melipona bicolor TaxID=60889 RepID=A0AA40GFH7_9HYME|nr:hypothetical protein K0M31_000820 [Melipona bicolor]